MAAPGCNTAQASANVYRENKKEKLLPAKMAAMYIAQRDRRGLLGFSPFRGIDDRRCKEEW